MRYPQMNNLTFSYPTSPLLTQWNRTDINCSPKLKKYNCVDNFCTCPYTEIIKKGDLVEVVLVALGKIRNFFYNFLQIFLKLYI